MALFNQAKDPNMTAATLGQVQGHEEGPRPSTQNERIMDLIQRMTEKDKQIEELAGVLKRIAAFVGLPL